MAIENLPHKYRTGDTLPRLGFAIPWDIDGWTVTLVITRPDDTLTKTGTIVDPYDSDTGFGSGFFAWAEGDLVEGWRQKCVLRLADPSGNLMSVGTCFLNVDAMDGAT